VCWHVAATSKVIAAFHYGVRFALTQNQVLVARLCRLLPSLGTPRFDVAESVIPCTNGR
jgi:hypothetical protein